MKNVIIVTIVLVVAAGVFSVFEQRGIWSDQQLSVEPATTSAQSHLSYAAAVDDPVDGQDQPLTSQMVGTESDDDIFDNTDPSLITGVDFNELLKNKPYEKYRVVAVNSDLIDELPLAV